MTNLNNTMVINGTELNIKEYNGQRVVTLKDIDTVHNRPDGTARRNFNVNKHHLIEGEDYYKISSYEFRTAFGNNSMDKRQQNDIVLITELGYLLLVKSFTDDLAWDVQRKLVNTYFKYQTLQTAYNNPSLDMATMENRFISLEMELKAAIEHQYVIQETKILSQMNELAGIRKPVNISYIDCIAGSTPYSYILDKSDLYELIASIKELGGYTEEKQVFNRIYDIMKKQFGINLEYHCDLYRANHPNNGYISTWSVILHTSSLYEKFIAIAKEMKYVLEHYGDYENCNSDISYAFNKVKNELSAYYPKMILGSVYRQIYNKMSRQYGVNWDEYAGARKMDKIRQNKMLSEIFMEVVNNEMLLQTNSE